MKLKLPLVFAMSVLLLKLFSAEGSYKSTILDHLIGLNSQWKKIEIKDLNLYKERNFDDDNELITLHLQLVLEKLKSKEVKHLETSQQENRKNCLEILQKYIARGVYPKNLYHQSRTPYFIDDFGTACAVGQLIISSGYQDLALRISRENNYAYIEDLPYKEVAVWAERFGFEIDELKWIQPSYINYLCGDTGCIYQAKVNVMKGKQPFQYKWSNGETTPQANKLCPNTSYSCIVKDSFGNVMADSNIRILYASTGILGGKFTFPSIEPFYISLSSKNDNGSCNGSASVKVILGDTTGVSYLWPNKNKYGQTIDSLCTGTQVVLVRNANGCQRIDSVFVKNGFSSISQLTNAGVIPIYPSPIQDIYTIDLSGKNIPIDFYLYNSTHQLVQKVRLTNKLNTLDRKGLSDGIYHYEMNSNQGLISSGKILLSK